MTAPATPTTIKLTIALTLDGQETLIKGLDLYSWNFYDARLPADGVTCALGEAPLPKGYRPLGEIEITLPTKEACVPAVLNYFAKREQELMVEHREDLHKLAARRADVLALPAPAPLETPADFDDSSY